MHASAPSATVPRIDRRLLQSWTARVEHHLEVAGLLAWEIVLPPRLVSPLHEHELPFFCALVDGAMENRHASRTISYHPHLNVFHPAGTVHSNAAGARGARLVTLEATAAWRARLDTLPPLPTTPAAVDAREAACLSRRLLRELGDPQPCSDLVLEGLALELLAATLRATPVGAPPPWLARVLARLHDELDGRFTLASLADEAGVHPAQLSAVFRRHTGRTLGVYRRELRVESVRIRLHDRRGADEPLASIALAAGFADQAHCTRVFKAATGWTPARYRKAALAGAVPQRRAY